MDNKEIKRKRMLGFDVDYPLIKKIKSSFRDFSICSNFEPANSGDYHSVSIPLIQFEYVLQHSGTDLEKHYVKEVLHLLRMAEVRTIFQILKDNDCLEKGLDGDIVFSDNPNIGIYHPDIVGSFFVKQNLRFAFELEHLEEGSMDNGALYDNRHCLILKMRFEK